MEIRTTQGGKKIANLSLGITEKWKDASGGRKERTEWVRVAIFNEGLVGVAERFLRKGSRCYIEGQLATRKWADQSGQERHSTEVVLQGYSGTLVLLDGRPQEERREEARPEEPAAGKPSSPAGDWDEIPF